MTTYFQVQDMRGTIYSDHMTWAEAQTQRRIQSDRYQAPFRVVKKEA